MADITFPEPPEHPRFENHNGAWYFLKNDYYKDTVENLLRNRVKSQGCELEAQDMIHCAVAGHFKTAKRVFGTVKHNSEYAFKEYFESMRKARAWLALMREVRG